MGKAGRIPSLDGWRAVSIIIVLVGHELISGSRFGLHSGIDRLQFFAWHPYGVQIFFIISGFIITNLLLKEEKVFGCVNLRDFYKRRFYRIVPPLFAYLLILFFLSFFFHSETIKPVVWIASFLFFTNITSLGTSWSTLHLWSLSVEEQYYIFWPLIFLNKKFRTIFPLIFICVGPILRVIEYKKPGTIGEFSFFVRADAIFAGALFALYQDSLEDKRWLRKIEFPILILAFSGLLCQKLIIPFSGFLTIPFNSLLFSASIIILIRWSLIPESILYKILNMRFSVWIGKLSYSLYLWQELFYPGSIFGLRMYTIFPLNFLCMFVLAAASYYLIEDPVRRWRQKVKQNRYLVVEKTSIL